MDKQTSNFNQYFSWFHDPQQLPNDFIHSNPTSSQNDQPLIPINKTTSSPHHHPNYQTLSKQSISSFLNFNKEQISTQNQQFNQSKQQNSLKRQLQQTNQRKTSIKLKSGKDQKQGIYSKTYRQRKKQHYNNIQKQNQFLKKRIKQLEYQLRQKQVQLNRFKFPPPQKQLSLQQFNKQFIQKGSIKVQQKKKMRPQQIKKVLTPNDQQYHQFIQSYNYNGFAGEGKLKILDYHFNQIMQTMLKDSQRYLMLVFNNSKYWNKLQPLDEYEILNKAFYDVFKLNQQLNQRLNYFVRNLYGYFGQISKHISEFNNSYQRIIQCSHKIHNFVRQTYLTNMDIAWKRVQLQSWFQFHKYGKLMRKLRFQWIQFIKENNHIKEDNKTHGKGNKKKKVNKQQLE